MPSALPTPRLPSRVSARCLVTSLLALAFLSAAPTAAQAHTDLLDSSPADGATLDRAPREITLTFSDDIDPKFATVVLTVGNHRERLDTTVERGEVTAAVPTEVDAGTPDLASWKVAYRVVSADGHPVNGAIGFEAPAPPRPASTPDADSSATPEASSTPKTTDALEPAASSDTSSDESPLVWVLVLGAGLVLIVPALAWKFRRRPPS